MSADYLPKIEIPDQEIMLTCSHCGMCLAVCPTYNLTLMERSSPRGRIRLIKQVAEGNLTLSETFIDEMDFCLDCQACQSVCPAGVHYGQLVEASRAQIADAGLEKGHWLKRFFFRIVFVSHFRLKLLARLLRFYQNYFQDLVRKSGVLRLAPKVLRRIEPLSPKISIHFSDEVLTEIMSPPQPAKYRIGFLKGCLMNIMFAEINQDTVAVLLANDCEVIMPKNQVCCGSLAAHNGDFDIAKKLARLNIDEFLRDNLDAIVINSAGCSAFMKEYGQLLQDDLQYRDKAAKISRMTKDIHEFLLEIDYKKPTIAINKKITYHDACHLAHTQKITEPPRQILTAIPGIEYVELNEANWCCGSAGIYNIIRYEDAMQILERKLTNIQATGADILITANPGCMGQIDFGLRQQGSNIQVMNSITLLKMAYDLDSIKK